LIKISQLILYDRYHQKINICQISHQFMIPFLSLRLAVLRYLGFSLGLILRYHLLIFDWTDFREKAPKNFTEQTETVKKQMLRGVCF
jgi:hypothetical protein